MRIAYSLAILLFGISLSVHCGTTIQSLQSSKEPREPEKNCKGHVYIKDGQFMLEEQPYRFKSVNYRVSITAEKLGENFNNQDNDKSIVDVDGKSYRLVNTMGAYSPDNNSFCRTPIGWNPEVYNDDNRLRCCRDRDECRSRIVEHIEHMKGVGINSIRLLMDYVYYDNANPKVDIIPIYPELDSNNQHEKFTLDLLNQQHRTAFFRALKDAIDLFGDFDIRSILLVDGTRSMVYNSAQNQNFINWLKDLAILFKNNPNLAAIDFFNEPSYHQTHIEVGKLQVKPLIESWVHAIRNLAGNDHVLTTIGSSKPADIGSWDPALMPVDFINYHVYGKDGRPYSEMIDAVNQEIFHMAINSCGKPCPFGGAFDGANCFHGKGRVTYQGEFLNETFYELKNNQLISCQDGTAGFKCPISNFIGPKYQTFILMRPYYYVSAQNGQCPTGSTYDGANCLYFKGPPHANGFIYQNGFYYSYLSNEPGKKCQSPAWDDGANCKLGTFASGWSPFILTAPHFYSKPVTCSSYRRPYIIGETGFTNHKLDPVTGLVVEEAHGSLEEQAQFLSEFFTQSHQCMSQGLQWWQFGDVKWGTIFQDHYGMWGDFRQVYPGAELPEFNAIALKPVGNIMALLNFYQSSNNYCERPDSYNKVPYQVQNFLYHGRVVDQNGKGVPFAKVNAWESGWANFAATYTNGEGFFIYNSTNPRLHMSADAHGYLVSSNITPNASGFNQLTAFKLPASFLADYDPPSVNKISCQRGSFPAQKTQK